MIFSPFGSGVGDAGRRRARSTNEGRARVAGSGGVVKGREAKGREEGMRKPSALV